MDSNDEVNLAILTSDDSSSWMRKLNYGDSWSKNDQAIFLKANQASKGEDIPYKELRIKREATVSELIKAARQLFPGYDKDIEEVPANDKLYIEGKWPISYSMFYPAFYYDFLYDRYPLSNSSRLSKLGITDGELILLDRTVEKPWKPPNNKPLAYSIKSFKDFQEMIAPKDTPNYFSNRFRRRDYFDDIALYATLLYTDEDPKLATYVREHFDDLNKMSGPKLMVYIVEEPPKGSAYTNMMYWKVKLEHANYLAWSLLGWVKNKPYDKSAAYEIAHSLGVFPDQLPCVIVFDRKDRKEKIIVPVQGDYTLFFRTLFSNIQRYLYSEGPQESTTKDIENIDYGLLYGTLRTALEGMDGKEEPERTIYNFYGQTLFINHPTGSLQLRDFLNTQSKSGGDIR